MRKAQPHRLLIVEDEVIVALDLRSRLEDFGYQVIDMLTTGEDAIDLVDKTPPDLILMDIRLDGLLDGIQTAKVINDKHDIPVVYLTANTDDTTIFRAMETEPYGYIFKPFEDRELQKTIEMALHKHALEVRVRQQANQLQRIVDAVPAGVVLLDADMRIVLSNPQAQETLTALQMVPPSGVLTMVGALSCEALTAPQSQGVWHETPVQERILEVIIVPARDSAYVFTGLKQDATWVLVMRDVTQERDILKRAQQQSHMAAIGQLAAGVAHDFNNILNAIKLSLHVMMKEAQDQALINQDRLNTVYQQTKRATDLVTQIMDFSRSFEMQFRPTDVQPILKELRKMLERTLPENITLEVHVEPGSFITNGDATRIVQVLMNLALNARDAMPGGGTLTISLNKAPLDAKPTPNRAGQPPDQTGWIQLAVSDTGTGIPQEVLPRIFEPFFTTKAPGHGVGLGLAQVYGIVQQHQGHIDVKTVVGVGTTFTIFIPDISTIPEKGATRMKLSSVRPAAPTTIMVVEDYADTRDAMVALLEIYGYVVIAAEHGKDALAKLDSAASPVELIITDMVMPHMGGLDLCREIRSRGLTLPLIVVTGYSPQDVLEDLKSATIFAILMKPVEPETLLATIGNALEPVKTTSAS
jgi:hypothetical protein